MGGKSKPKAPPDYTNEKAAFAESELAKRTQQATDYNSQTNDYNQLLQGNLSSLNDLGTNIGNLGIRDADQFSGFERQLGNLNTAFQNNYFQEEKPFFESTVNSPWGAVSVGAPSLDKLNNQAKTNFQSGYGSNMSLLDSLQEQRKAEEKRIADFRTGLLTELGNSSSSLEGLGIADKGRMDSLRDTLSDINNRRSNFSSEILDQVRPGGFTKVQSGYDTAMTGLEDLYAARGAEEQRIENFRGGLRDNYDNFLDSFSTLGIADESAFESLQDQIDASQLGAGRFDSDLHFDFGNSLNNLQDLENKVGQLRNERSAELARIEGAENLGNTAAFSLENSLDNANIYDLANLQSLRRQVNAGRNDIGGFTSDLDFSFDDTLGRFDTIDTALNDMFTRREDRLDNFSGDIASQLSSISGAEHYDEDAFNNALSELNSYRSGLGRFSGTDVNNIQYALDDALSSGNDRLEDLFDFRDNFETDLQSELEALQNRNFGALDEFDDPTARATELQDQIDLYGASQASDELAAFNEHIASARGRLQQDLLNSSTPSQVAVQGATNLLNQSGNSNLTPEQYLAMLTEIEDEEELLNVGGFSGNVLRL